MTYASVKQISVSIKRFALIILASVIGLSGLGIWNFQASASQGAGVDNLKQTIDAILADPRLNGAQASVLVRAADDGEVLYSRNPSTLLIPASNNKLYSSSAAMQALGADHTFETSIAFTGALRAGILSGDLYLKGTGDPTMQAADYDKLATDLAAKGVKLITGKLIADDTFFDDRQLGYNWGWDSNPFYYQPEISALTIAANSKYDINALNVEVRPGVVGRPAQVGTNPGTNFVTLQNEATTGPAGSEDTLSVERKLGVNTIVVKGNIPAGSPMQSVISTVSDPTGYAATTFRDALARHGITLLDKGIERKGTPANAQKLLSHQSAPLSSILAPYLKLSNNGIAEILVKTMGKKMHEQGNWQNGLEIELGQLEQNLGVDTNKLQFVDGSGLSNVNFTTPQLTTDLLIAVQSKPWFNTWYNSLPIAGNADPLVGGTLRSRMRNTPAANNVHAKTGSLDSVSALSGYVTTADGERLVFSVMENNYIASSVKPLEDAIATTLASFSRNSGVSRMALVPQLLEKTDAKDSGLECSWTKEGC
ncbi:MAG TPA: D-alanyl-D-alanine carboxypeptidase/D-alanyl-D-alanine-endopeptidase [Candidatus Saccharimonadales bacterium]|nr:D-alanyl-D-alanine carboxypeptidase/D-alanyl-D-alanine-endopeptidase [Candidatus Saccharimonadales bacterium]